MSEEDTRTSDHQLPHYIQPIDLVKHNPTTFWHNWKHFGESYEILGGNRWGLTTFGGAAFAVAYFNARNSNLPTTYYKKIGHVWGRIIFGGFLGAAFGYWKFADRQRIHNAYTADRLYRRYPECKSITTTGLSELRGKTPHQEYYRWA